MRDSIYIRMKSLILITTLFLIGIFSSIAQNNMTKIKDGTISGTSAVPNLGVVLELESVNKGFLTPRLSTAQRDAIVSANRVDGLLIYNTTTGCFNYWSTAQDAWLSLCGTPPPAVVSITEAQCKAIQVNGNYKQGEGLNASNSLTIPVTVTQAGTYDFIASTDNGYYFSATGTFPNSGNYSIVLQAMGTPSKGYDLGEAGDQVMISLNNKVSTCTPSIYVEKADVDYTINCSTATALGDYMIGVPLTENNKIVLEVNVTSTGYWSITSNTANGYSFKGSGNFTSVGKQTIELLGTGAPLVSGNDLFNITSNAKTPTSCSSITVTTKPIKYTVDCTQITVGGEFTEDVPVTSNHNVKIKVNIEATGDTSISTNTVAGIQFVSGPLSFDTLGEKEVILTASGTPTTPGIHNFSLVQSNGLTNTCSFDVEILPQPVAYSLTCSSIVVNGAYAPDIEMNNTNTITLTVNVQYPGNYEIKTDTVDGVTFTGTGTFPSAGNHDVILTASGKAKDGGEHVFTISTNSVSGGNTCTVKMDFIYRRVTVLGLGGGMYQPGTATNSQASKAILLATSNFSVSGTLKTEGITIVNGGTYQGTALMNLINNNKIDIIVIGYNYLPNSASIAILDDFVKNKKGVLIHSQENDAAGTINLINKISDGTAAISVANQSYTNPTVNLDDPVLNGPFGDVRLKAGGSDVNNSYYITGYSGELVNLAHQDGNETRSWMLRHKTLGYVYIGDSGWTAGVYNNTSTTTWPAAISQSGVPLSKNYSGSVTVYNSFLFANTMAWAIKYVQLNTDVNYLVK